MNISTGGRIFGAAIAALLFSSFYYGAFVGGIWRELSGTTEAIAMWQPVAQLVRNIVVASALAYLLRRIRSCRVLDSLAVSLVVWLGFQAMAIAGSVIHEHYSLGLYAIHTLDQLATIVIMTLFVATTRAPELGHSQLLGTH